MKSFGSTAVLLAALVATAYGQESARVFNLYGFMDATMTKQFSRGAIKLEHGFIKMKTVGDYEEFEDLYDMHLLHTQFSVAF